jgi:hypothetical protein
MNRMSVPNLTSACPICQKPLERKGSRGPSPTFCRKCRYQKKVAGMYRFASVCETCGTRFKAVNQHQRRCSRACQISHSTAIRRISRDCLACGAAFMPTSKLNVYCSVACSHAGIDCECYRCGTTFKSSGATMCPKCSRRKHDALHTHRRRTWIIGGDRIDPYEIYERDEWRCGICGDPVDKTLRWPDPMSASLDHITPLSKGGRHAIGNVQCSHLRCNLRKRDGIEPSLSPSLYRSL